MSAPGVFRDTSPGASCGGCERGPSNRPGPCFVTTHTSRRTGDVGGACASGCRFLYKARRARWREGPSAIELREQQKSGTGGPSRELRRRGVLRPSGHSRFLTALSDSDSASGENDTFCSGCVNGEGGGNAVSHAERRNPLDFK